MVCVSLFLGLVSEDLNNLPHFSLLKVNFAAAATCVFSTTWAITFPAISETKTRVDMNPYLVKNYR